MRKGGKRTLRCAFVAEFYFAIHTHSKRMTFVQVKPGKNVLRCFSLTKQKTPGYCEYIERKYIMLLLVVEVV